MEGLIILFTLIVLLFSVIIHEIAHGSVAYYLGDPTAKHAGRLTLNPLKHLDPFGSVLLPLFLFLISAGKGPIFGWTKPVPINPYKTKRTIKILTQISAINPESPQAPAIIIKVMIANVLCVFKDKYSFLKPLGL